MALIYVFWVDPGGTSGWSCIGVDEHTIFSDRQGKIMRWDCGEVSGSETSQTIQLMHIAAQYHPLAFGIEDFDARQPFRQKEYLSPVRVGSKLELCLDTHYIIATGPFWQMPSLAMSTASDHRLRVWGLYKPGSEHARDATRHAITFIRRAKDDRELATEAWPLYEHTSGRSRSARRHPTTQRSTQLLQHPMVSLAIRTCSS